MLNTILFLLAPQAFDMVLNVVRPLFSSATQNAVKVFDSNKRVWMRYLVHEISRNQRSIEFGGTKRNYGINGYF